jgi:hypothetical protein
MQDHMFTLRRRAVLKALMLLGIASTVKPRRVSAADCPPDLSYNALYNHPPWLGRVEWEQPVYRSLESRLAANVARMLAYHDIIPIYNVVHAEAPAGFQHNDVWFETDGGVVHSSFVVPCHEAFNTPEDVIGEGFWGEVTVPLTMQRWEPSTESVAYNPLRWGTVYRVVDRADDACGTAWYRLRDDVYPHQAWWVSASHIRRITPAELAPISPHVPPADKRIEVSIPAQSLTCFEGAVPVFSTRLSSGGIYYDASGAVYPFPTSHGELYVQRKTPSRHMIGGSEINNPYDLPGVPWCTYFSVDGEAIHGATTHNDFGAPRSHGCLNVTPDAAKWIYRWSTPSTDYDAPDRWLEENERDQATAVIVGA